MASSQKQPASRQISFITFSSESAVEMQLYGLTAERVLRLDFFACKKH